DERNSFADENVLAANPKDRISPLMASRTYSSSSTIAIRRRLVRTTSPTLPERFCGTADLPFFAGISRYTTLGGKCSPCDLYETCMRLYEGVSGFRVWPSINVVMTEEIIRAPPTLSAWNSC